MLPLMVMEMEAQSFNTQGQGLDAQGQYKGQGLGTQSLFNGQGQGLEAQGHGLVKGQGLGTVMGYEGIVMEEPLWSYRNSNSYDHRNRVLQEDGDSGMPSGDDNNLIAI